MKMSAGAGTRPTFHLKLDLFLAAAMLCGVTAQARAVADMPDEYYADSSGALPSAWCAKNYPSHLVLPRSRVRHTYLLLLVFSNKQDSQAAGQSLFHADPAPAAPMMSCTDDPDHATTDPATTAHAAAAAPWQWALIVKGGCPTDCTNNAAPGVISLDKTHKKIAPVGPVTAVDPDPLLTVSHHQHWGIFAIGSFPASEQVWQIQVKDAVHASNILAALEKKGLALPVAGSGNKVASGMAGYLGHMLIGYQPK
jgi:hypothetical protein